jgi:hypothetical protein
MVAQARTKDMQQQQQQQEQQQPKRWHDAAGEEYGLVPARYLKRKQKEESTRQAATPAKESRSDLPGKNSLKDTHSNNTAVVEKTPEEIANHLNELNSILSYHYTVAKLADSPYRKESKICMLRAEAFQVQLAARRIESNWKIKMELFKTQDRKVSWKDLLPAVAERGHVQLLPTRDLAGRAVLCFKFDPTLYSNQEQEVGSMSVFFCVSQSTFVSHSLY